MTIEESTGAQAEHTTESVRPLNGPFARLKWSAWAVIIFNALLVPLYLLDIWALTPDGADWLFSVDPNLTVYNMAFAVLGIGAFVVYVLSVIFVCLWTFRAMKNLHTVKSRVVEVSPGWAVGWYFIPFANLWMPFKGMSQIWHGSHDQAGMASPGAAGLNWWWALWIISNIVSNISIRLGGWDGTGLALNVALWLDVFTSFTFIICAWLLISITQRVSEVQTSMEGGAMANVFD